MRIEFFSLFAALFLTGCSQSRHVLFADAVREPMDMPEAVSAYFDRDGSLYPGPGAGLTNDLLIGMDGDYPKNYEYSLKAYYEHAYEEGDRTWAALLRYTGMAGPDPDASFGRVWEEIQDTLVNRIVADLHARTEGGTRPLTILIHGFNTEAPGSRAWYDSARVHIRALAPRSVFLDVYWDGLIGTRIFGRDPIGNTWGEAQFNFPLIGLEFRRVLNRLDALNPSLPVRILTHSSGGPLIASTLWDASEPLDEARDRTDPRYIHYADRIGGAVTDYRPPAFGDLRVGMIVPAMPGITFAGYDQNASRPSRIIVGINHRDSAISKLGTRCSALGSTCLSGRPEEYCRHVVPAFAGDHPTDTYVFDFSGSSNNPQEHSGDSHAMIHYLQRDDMASFLRHLYEEEVTVPDETNLVCGP